MDVQVSDPKVPLEPSEDTQQLHRLAMFPEGEIIFHLIPLNDNGATVTIINYNQCVKNHGALCFDVLEKLEDMFVLFVFLEKELERFYRSEGHYS